MRPLTEKEELCLSLSRDLANALANLPELAPADLDEAYRHLHVIQYAVMARPAFEHINNVNGRKSKRRTAAETM